jgi:hypothetical protein
MSDQDLKDLLEHATLLNAEKKAKILKECNSIDHFFEQATQMFIKFQITPDEGKEVLEILSLARRILIAEQSREILSQLSDEKDHESDDENEDINVEEYLKEYESEIACGMDDEKKERMKKIYKIMAKKRRVTNSISMATGGSIIRPVGQIVQNYLLPLLKLAKQYPSVGLSITDEVAIFLKDIPLRNVLKTNMYGGLVMMGVLSVISIGKNFKRLYRGEIGIIDFFVSIIIFTVLNLKNNKNK